MRNEFVLELAKGIEQLTLELGLDKEILINQAMITLRRQEKDIDILQEMKETQTRLEVAKSKFNNALDIADIEEAALEVTEAETRLSALRRLAKQNNIRSNTRNLGIVGYADR